MSQKSQSNFNDEEWWEKHFNRHPSEKIVELFAMPRIKIIMDYVSINKNTKILDIGCGTGNFTYYFQKLSNEVRGMDNSPIMVKRNPCNNITLGDANNIPFPDKSFDLVFCSNLLHHVDDPKSIIKASLGCRTMDRGRVVQSY